MVSRRPLLLALLLLVRAGFAPAQAIRVQAPGGNLTGMVQDSASGLPIGYALAVLTSPPLRVFASEGGRFTLSGLAQGRATLRVQQIGYRPLTLTLDVDINPGGAGAPGLVVRLSRQVFQLPEIIVEGDICSGERERSGFAEEGLLGAVYQNAERLFTLQEDYPFEETYQEATARYDTTGTVIGGRVDTGHYDSRRILRYEKGHVTVREGPFQVESALYFQPSDLARNEFRRTHCFWYAGNDSVAGAVAYHFEFAPLSNVKSIDWAGSLFIDSTSMVLVRSEAHLVNLTRRNSSFLSASCTLAYRQVMPTLVTPEQARCVSRHQSKPPYVTVARWLLIQFRFLGRTPSGPESSP